MTALFTLAALLILAASALVWFARMLRPGAPPDRALAIHAGLQIFAMLIAALSVVLGRQTLVELAGLVLVLALAVAVSGLKLLRYGSLQPRLAPDEPAAREPT